MITTTGNNAFLNFDLADQELTGLFILIIMIIKDTKILPFYLGEKDLEKRGRNLLISG